MSFKVYCTWLARSKYTCHSRYTVHGWLAASIHVIQCILYVLGSQQVYMSFNSRYTVRGGSQQVYMSFKVYCTWLARSKYTCHSRYTVRGWLTVSIHVIQGILYVAGSQQVYMSFKVYFTWLARSKYTCHSRYTVRGWLAASMHVIQGILYVVGSQ